MNQKGERDSGVRDEGSNIIKPMSGDTLSGSRTLDRILNRATFCSRGGATATAEGLPISTMTDRWIGRPGSNREMPSARGRVLCDLIADTEQQEEVEVIK